AVRLARLVVELLPDEGEAVGLLGLLLLHHSRRRARTDAAGDLVLLDDQDRSAWDHDAIREGASCAAAALRRGRGTYAIQAAIAACHATAPAPDRVDWPAIAGFYVELVDLDPSPAIVLNRAVAVAEVDGPAAGLAMIDSLVATDAGRALARSNHHADAARGALLVRLDRPAEAVEAYRRALTLAPTDPERRFLARRIADLDHA
ncbi:MAG: polymerase subunit sigma-24, partial [Acidimicrobiales bacterium]|nr:polymerase subunit sigma-24 [Acidimicrobiales bacterium]